MLITTVQNLNNRLDIQEVSREALGMPLHSDINIRDTMVQNLSTHVGTAVKCLAEPVTVLGERGLLQHKQKLTAINATWT